MTTQDDNPGRAARAGLVLLTRAECGLCEQMHAALLRLSTRVPLPPITLVDVDADPQLQRRWGLKIPVLLLDGSPVCRTRLDEQALSEALAQAARAGAGAAPSA
ncbi:MAG: glutaredoxin family protein, partial [Steroidobacteraceae bacterium]